MTTDALVTGRLEQLSARDVLDLAVLMEEEARERYLALAGQVGGRYAGDAGDVFRAMAANEARHGAQLVERRRRLFGDAPRAVTREMLFEVEAPGLSAPRVFMSGRQAMEVALESERKAREFFEEALSSATDPQVRSLLTELRDEEAGHERLVRAHLADLAPGPDVEDDEADEPGTDPG
jgi:erythrin-vacuolar iron transport family protein